MSKRRLLRPRSRAPPSVTAGPTCRTETRRARRRPRVIRWIYWLNVLARDRFGKSFNSRGHDERKTNQRCSIHELQAVSPWASSRRPSSLFILALGPEALASLAARYWLPLEPRIVNEAVVSFQTHMTAMYEEQKRAFAARHKNSNRFLTLWRSWFACHEKPPVRN
ncbi:hypothetical protein F5X96DRAFT_673413 [Biscogniauxia mediterranea]|nr:hypothetical protein F5X96DRAFT_673413 [Biscogniauxia mediterranea]